MQFSQMNVAYIGGCGGIGSAACKRFAKNKVANLAILDLVENVDLLKTINDLSPTTNVFFVKIDLRCKETIKECFQEVISRMGFIDILVNGGGLINEKDLELTIQVNLLGLIHSTLAALDLMDKSKGGRGGVIVNIASVAGLNPLPIYKSPSFYCASKAGVVMFTRSQAVDPNLTQTGISLITMCPGGTETPLLNQHTSDSVAKKASQLHRKTFGAIKMQSADDCARCIMDAIELNKNGAVYVCDLGENQEVTIPKFWIPQRDAE